MKQKWIWFVLLILSFTFGVAFTAFATSKGAVVLEKGRIIHTDTSYKFDNKSGNRYEYFTVTVAYDGVLYTCRIRGKANTVTCVGYTDVGAFLAD